MKSNVQWKCKAYLFHKMVRLLGVFRFKWLFFFIQKFIVVLIWRPNGPSIDHTFAHCKQNVTSSKHSYLSVSIHRFKNPFSQEWFDAEWKNDFSFEITSVNKLANGQIYSWNCMNSNIGISRMWQWRHPSQGSQQSLQNWSVAHYFRILNFVIKVFFIRTNLVFFCYLHLNQSSECTVKNVPNTFLVNYSVRLECRVQSSPYAHFGIATRI